MSLLLTSLLWLVLHCMLALTSVGSCATVALPLAPSCSTQRVLLHHLSNVSCRSSSGPLHLSSCVRPSRGQLRGRYAAHPAQACTALGGAVRAVLLTQLAGAAVLSNRRSRRTSMHMVLLLLLSCLVVQLTHSKGRGWAGRCCLVLLWWQVVAIRCGTTASSSAAA